MQQTGHRRVEMLRRYIRDGNLFSENAAKGLALSNKIQSNGIAEARLTVEELSSRGRRRRDCHV
jgi:hypothetical protein